MPNTFTDSGITLIGDGEESGTWGQVTNENLEIISRLTSERQNVTLSGTTGTVNVSDGGSSAGQHAVLVFGGSPSGTNTVTITPNSAKRVFIVQNLSNETVILKQGTGTTVTIPDDGRAIVYCTGTGTGASVVDVTPLTVPLQAISALTPTDGNFIVGNGTTWVTESGNTVLTSLGVTATATELNYLDGADGNIQDQIDAIVAAGGANNSTITLAASTGLTGGGFFTLNQASNKTITFTAVTQSESTWETGTSTTEGVVSPAKVRAAIEEYTPGRVLAKCAFDGTAAVGTISVEANAVNVSNVTKADTGLYVINFASNLPNSNYSVAASSGNLSGAYTLVTLTNPSARAVGTCSISSILLDGTVADSKLITVTVFG